MVDITPILVAIITVLGSIVTAYVIPLLKSKISTDKQQVVLSVADAVVLAVEQVFIALDGPDKKAQAVERVKAWLAKYQITVDDSVIDDAIEAAVKRMNLQAKGAELR